jgi:transposase InsO family protein
VLRREGHRINRTKVQRLWREEGLRVPPKRRKRQRLGQSTTPADRLRAQRPDHVWTLDYQFDLTATGHTIKIVHVVDEFTRESLADVVDYSIDADATVAALEKIAAARGRHPPAHPLRQRPRTDRQRPAGLVPLRRRRRQLHPTRLTLAEPLGRVLRLPDAR